MSKYKPADPGSPERRYIGKPCEHHPDEGGVRYKTGNRCVVCVAVARDLWKKLNKKKVVAAAKRYRKNNADSLNLALRNRRRVSRGLDPVADLHTLNLKPSAWVLEWEKDHPGHRLTTEDIANYLTNKNDVVHSYRRKVNAARMAAWRAKKRLENSGE